MSNRASRGKKAKTRHKISRKGSKVTVNKMLQQIPVGSKVDIKINSSMQGRGEPFRRYHGMTGTVIGKQGSAFIVTLYNGNQPVELVIGPAHLTVSKGSEHPGNPGHAENAGHAHKKDDTAGGEAA